MTRHDLTKTKTSEIKWSKKNVGRDAIVSEKPLDPIIIKNMPHEVDSFMDVKLTKLLLIRINMRISKLIRTLLGD